MNHKRHILILLMLGMMTFMPSICFARGQNDTLVIHRVWSYASQYQESREGVEQNAYIRYTFNTIKRNALLLTVPTMHAIAKGSRRYTGEVYYRMRAHDDGSYDFNRQVVSSTIPRNRDVMTTVGQYMTPNLYNETLFGEQVLSPFHYANRFFYKYRIIEASSTLSIIRFRPRTDNTQLVKGQTIVETATGRIHSVTLTGNVDMTTFELTVVMDDLRPTLTLPKRCSINAVFKFMGNHITANFQAHYNCPTTLPDSVVNVDSREMMDTLRPIPLSDEQNNIYKVYDEEQLRAAADTTHKEKHSKFRDFMWKVVGDNLLNGQKSDNGAVSLRMSPLFNPLYFGYSKSQGLSYKLNLGVRYSWNDHRYLTLRPLLGYNFKHRQFYYVAPLRMTYNPKRDGYAEVKWANGNHITNSLLNETIREQKGDDIDLPEFKDQYLQVVNNIELFDWLEVTTGLVYHRRKALQRQLLHELHLPLEYRSFAPLLTLQLRPWQHGPVLTANYEHGIKGVIRSNLKYERWEFDLSHHQKLKSLRAINYRLGTGFYTQRSSNYFVDFTNFRDNNLPSGWEDEWTGQFQLLKSQWYNESDYYIRGNISFESPLLALTWIPGIGRLLEMERIYLSVLSIEHTRPYFELGYGFTNRYFSTGIFTSFLNTKFQGIGCRFTFELFRRW